jgi:F0F1-type ATP synthase assembly protein I
MTGDPRPEGEKQPKPWVNATAAGTELAVTVLVGFGGGYWLDSVCGTAPWLTILGALAGMVLALYRLVRSSRIDKKNS